MSEITDYLLRSNKRHIKMLQQRIREVEENYQLLEKLLNELREEELLALVLYVLNSKTTRLFTAWNEGDSKLDIETDLYKNLRNYLDKRTVNDLRGEHPFDGNEALSLFLSKSRKMLQSANLKQAYKIIRVLSSEDTKNEEDISF